MEEALLFDKAMQTRMLRFVVKTFLYRRQALLLKYVDCFAWSYEEMPSLDPQSTSSRLIQMCCLLNRHLAA